MQADETENQAVGAITFLKNIEDNAPICRMCNRKAHYIFSRQVYANYCGSKGCENRERLCQSCGTEFLINANGAGTKYCSAECKAIGYHPTTKPSSSFCAWCNAPNPSRNRTRTRNLWPYICKRCLDPIKHVVERLKDHHVPHSRAKELINDSKCELCGSNLLDLIRFGNSRKFISNLTVDHDHNCCPGNFSCGKCIRGLICRHCNWALGAVRDRADVAMSLASYLGKWQVLVNESPQIEPAPTDPRDEPQP